MTESAAPPPTRPRWVLPVLIGTVVLVLLAGAAFATVAITSLASAPGTATDDTGHVTLNEQ
ncbi:hypothetical protein [Agromyces atrinae]|uniref:Uncharacterized protein n=1 Tax=Agromyces atrinae TaxID=592376 RepID=A0A4Q2MF00_9MICO|nr:hypothetical protein [Agromyces atrinae]NYD68148.1 hypothetical protein [Agromyces atrinae]RXZ87710.1 hypothetical protein ESP50_00430 [Agromyces atrinae]